MITVLEVLRPIADALPVCGLGDAQLKPVRLARTELLRSATPTSTGAHH